MSLKIFSGDNSRLSNGVSDYLNHPLSPLEAKRFNDGEERVQLLENIRKSDVFVVQSTNPPAENLMRLCMMINAARRSSASEITAVIPYFGYARQDRKDRPRVAITSRMVVDFIEAAGADRVLTMDMHVNQMEGFFSIPVDHIYARFAFLPLLQKMAKDFVVIAPDAGAASRAKGYAQRLGKNPVAHVHKERDDAGDIELITIIGNVRPEQTALIVDDMIDTGGTIIRVADALHKNNGVKDIIAAAAHGILSQNAISRMGNSCLSNVYLTDTIQYSDEKLKEMEQHGDKFQVVSVAEHFGKAIHCIAGGESVSTLFE